MGSGETINLYDRDDKFVDVVVLPAHYMEFEPQRWIVVEGKKYVEGGGEKSFYGRGQFAEVEEIISEHAG